MDAVTVIIANWWWIAPIILVFLGGLKWVAKKTRWVIDDHILTLLIGLVRISMGRDPQTGMKTSKP